MTEVAGTQFGQVVHLREQTAFKFRMRRPAVKPDKPAQLLLFMGVHYERHETGTRTLPPRDKKSAPHRSTNAR